MADSVLEVVEKLQSRLSPNAEPKKLHKTLKRLAELPVTVDILVETGVGKAVNGLRKHEVVGDFAKALVAQWKKLVPQETPRTSDPDEREHRKSSVKKHPRSPSPKEDEPEDDYEEDIHPLHDNVDEMHMGLGDGHREYIQEKESWRRYSDREDSDDGHGYSPEPSHSPPSLYMDTYSERSLHKQSKEHKSSYKDKHHPEPIPERKKDKPAIKEHTSSAGSSRDKLLSPESRQHSSKKDRNKHSISKGQTEESTDAKKQKHPEKSKSEKHLPSMDMHSIDKGKRPVERDSEYLHREKGDKNKVKAKPSEPSAQEKKSIRFSSPLRDSDMEEEFEKPTQSFEQCLSYDDQPKKKKKKTVVKPSVSVSSKSRKPQKENKSKEPSKQKAEPAPHKEHSSHKNESASTSLSKINQVPVLPDIPLPMIQPVYRPLPSIETSPVISKRKTPLVSAQEDDDSSGFTGRRFNSKMQVYSGSKTAYLPKMMSLYEQCIRVLANNIDSIYEVGGVPYSVLEPVLEKCTPDQLYRIEECNHVLIEDTDRLWMNHCQRDFKNQKAEEFESWREMYLRLHEAREQRLLMLTQNIRSAHANKPKGRQAKMAFVNSAVKPPRDVRRRQEKFGTGATPVAEKIRIKPFTPMSSSISSSNHVHSEEPLPFNEPSTSSSVSTPSSVQSGYDPRRPQVKKVAPMMAKTIKAFKNRFSRR
ncbi:elongin-A [Bombina bombina]|uniref:elongin-A n=1 Tax=Bombina bombina TaxID=8345 RepID=UPI00235A957C|nr:elongin-A [Bombina bombina]